MSFYLLKSTFKRQEVCDVLLDTNEINYIGIAEKEYDDLANPVYGLMINFKSRDTAKALFNTLDEVKKVIAEILKDKVKKEDLNDILPGKKS